MAISVGDAISATTIIGAGARPAAVPSAAMADARFEGVEVKKGEIRHGRDRVPLAGARVTVDSAGEIDRRITATRLVLTGPFALAFRKKKDRRGLYLMVEGPGAAFVVEVDPKKGGEARSFAAKVNALAGAVTAAPPSAAPPLPPPPAAPAVWAPDPTGRHETRYFDGARWTEHVADGGVQATDPV